MGKGNVWRGLLSLKGEQKNQHPLGITSNENPMVGMLLVPQTLVKITCY